MTSLPPVSVVVLVGERPEPLEALYREYAEPLRAAGIQHEFLFVIEPWAAKLAEPLQRLVTAGEPVRRLIVAQRVPESSLAQIGAEQARYELLLFMPAYRRIEARDLTTLLEWVEGGADLALACRSPRRDPRLNLLQAALFRLLLRQVARRGFQDVASGVFAIRRRIMAEIPLYGEFFRFLPVLAAREGFTVEEVPVAQHAADRRTRIYPVGTYVRRLLDLFALFFLVRFTDRPLRFFGLVGSVLALVGSVILLVLLVQRAQGEAIADRPMLLLGSLLVVLGTQAIALGLVAEIIVHLGASRRRGYRLRTPEPPGSAASP